LCRSGAVLRRLREAAGEAYSCCSAAIHGGWELVAAEVGMMLCQVSSKIPQIWWIFLEYLILELLFVFIVEVEVRRLK
jgi:hypothetical protein